MTSSLKQEILNLPFKLEHVDKYVRYHESWQNGSKIKVLIKEEFCEQMGWVSYSEMVWGITKQGIYPPHASFEILGKDFPKFRKLVLKLVSKKENFKSTHEGVNAGTPIARSWEYNRFEMAGEEITKEVSS